MLDLVGIERELSDALGVKADLLTEKSISPYLIEKQRYNRQMPTKKKGRRTHITKVYCAKCQTLLYKYQKAGPGSLIKCYKDRIAEDYTRGDLKCPKCGETFAREAVYHGKPANKIIRGKVYIRS